MLPIVHMFTVNLMAFIEVLYKEYLIVRQTTF